MIAFARAPFFLSTFSLFFFFFFLSVLGGAATRQPARRLVVNGTQLLDGAQPVRLTGFNWQLGRTGPDPGRLQRQLSPRANVARLVGVLFGNTQPLSRDPAKECMTEVPPTYFNDACFAALDAWVLSATRAGLWVILAVRGEYLAGQNYASDPGSSVFRNATLLARLQGMWAHVAAHYSTFDSMAAYEILSEPRDKTVPPEAVRNVYEQACAAAHAGDAATPCMVGPAPYYKLYNLGPSTLLRNTRNAIYTFDYFNPDDFVFGQATHIPAYGPAYACATLYDGWVSAACPTWRAAPSQEIPFNRTWHEHNLRTWAVALQAVHPVPLFLNQFEVAHGVARAQGRYTYIADLLALLQELDMGWAWWTWAGGSGSGWASGSSEIVFRWPNGSVMIDTAVLQTMAPYMH